MKYEMKFGKSKSIPRKPSPRYFQLVSEFPLRKIQEENSYEQAMKMIHLFAVKKRMDSGTQEYFDVLIDLIADYEKRAGHALDTSHVTPADVVKHLATENGYSLSALATAIGIGQSNLSEMLSGKREWSKAAIKGLWNRFRIDPMLFLLA
jgi:antitoxin component HigA of HigAB toxin-antitoxin module